MKKIIIFIGIFAVLSLSACISDTTTQISFVSNTDVTSEATNITSTELIDYIIGLENPYNISLFVTEDLTTSIGINFEFPIDTIAYVEYSVLGEDSITKLEATQKIRYFHDKPVYLYEATLENLNSGVTYEYRIASEDNSEVSKFHNFTTLDNTKTTNTIMYLADPQENAEIGYMSYAFSVYYAMEFANKDIDLVMSPGDLIQDNDIRSEWNWFFKYSSLFSFNKPLAAAIGNHEMKYLDDEYINSLEFDGYLNLPNNGPTYNSFNDLQNDQRNVDFDKGKTYSFDIGLAHIVVIDTEIYCDGTTACINYDLENAKVLNNWVRNDLANSDSKWKIVMLHRGPYGLSYNTVSVRDNLAPIFDEYKVDLVLAGHEHQYSRAIYKAGELIPFVRSMSYDLGTISLIVDNPLNLDFNNYSNSIGVTYLTPNTSSTKFYGGSKSSGIEVNYAFTGMYPVIPMITISNESISIISYALEKPNAQEIIPTDVVILDKFKITK